MGVLARLAIGVAPAAFLGALVNAMLSASLVLLGLAALGGGRRFGSALTGTGGPVLLVSVLLALKVAPLRTVACIAAEVFLVVRATV